MLEREEEKKRIVEEGGKPFVDIHLENDRNFPARLKDS